jgi:hypothetical protein
MQTTQHPMTERPRPGYETEDSPFIIEFFLVQGIGFKCMAYLDPEGRWRRAFDNQELCGFIRVLE